VAREPVVMALGTGRWRWIYELSMVVLALVVVALLPLEDGGWVRVTNLAVWGTFVADYFTRLALSTDRRGFIRANIIDLLAIMPADFFRALRVLRLARLLRVLRAGSIMWRVTRDIRGVAGTNGLAWVLLVSLVTILAGAVAVWVMEPSIATLPDALWWSTVTATTVGYRGSRHRSAAFPSRVVPVAGGRRRAPRAAGRRRSGPQAPARSGAGAGAKGSGHAWLGDLAGRDDDGRPAPLHGREVMWRPLVAAASPPGVCLSRGPSASRATG
jgi:hypothetical protein